MGFRDTSDGYTKFKDGENVHSKLDKIETDQDEYEGETTQQLKLLFKAVPENGGKEGLVPAWFSSLITVKDNDDNSSFLGLYVDACDATEAIVRDLGADDELVEKVKNGEKSFEAMTPEENLELMEAVAKHTAGKVVRAHTEHNSKSQYSILKKVYEGVDEDPFPEEEGDVSVEAADEDDDEESESADDDEEEIEEASTSADVEKQEALA